MINVGIIGCGAIAQRRHIPEYYNNSAAKIVALCDSQKERAKKEIEKYNLKDVKIYGDYRQLLEDERIEAVSICTPNYLHHPAALKAADNKKHILCEKPLAVTEEEAGDMIARAADNGVFLMAAHNQRLAPWHQKAKEIITAGKLGQITSFKTTFGHDGPDNWGVDGKGSWFFDNQEAGIGVLADLGIHKVDLIRWLLDEEVTEIAAFYDTLVKEGDVDDNAVLILRLEGGGLGTASISWTYNAGEDNSTTIYGTEGIMEIRVTDDNHVVSVNYNNGVEEIYRFDNLKTDNSKVIDTFIDCIKSSTKPSISGEEGYKSLQVILAAQQAAVNGEVVQLI